MRRVLVMIALLALVAAACGGDDDGEIGSTSDDGAEQETTAPDEESAGDASADDGETDDEPATGDAGSEWCTAIRASSQDDVSPLDFDILGLSPEELEARFNDNIAVLEDWEAQAPPEISDQVTTMVDAFRTVVTLADAADWDLMVLATDPAFLEAFDTAELEAAADDIDRYSTDVCGVDLGVAGAAGSTGTPTPSVPAADGESATEFLEAFGLPRNFLNDEQLACVTRELEGAFPGGVPEEITLSPETIELFDRLGAACGIGSP